MGDNSIGEVLETLVPSYREALSPIQLPTFLGRTVYHRPVSEGGSRQSGPTGETSGKEYTWSKGLGLEISPIKTRSARKRKEELVHLFAKSHLPIICENKALRGMKDLAREKS